MTADFGKEVHFAPFTTDEIEATTIAMAERCRLETTRSEPGSVMLRAHAVAHGDGAAPIETAMFLAEVALLSCAETLGRLHYLQGLDLTFLATLHSGWMIATATADMGEDEGSLEFEVVVSAEATSEPIAKGRALSPRSTKQ